jgi:hypothetical protein
VYAFRRTAGADTVTVFLNFGATPATVDGPSGDARDAFTGAIVAAGSRLALGPRGFRVLVGSD